MWYDSANTTIYWYTAAVNVYYPPNSSFFYSKMQKVNEISGISGIKTDYMYDLRDSFIKAELCFDYKICMCCWNYEDWRICRRYCCSGSKRRNWAGC